MNRYCVVCSRALSKSATPSATHCRPCYNRRDLFWQKVDQSGGPSACWPWMARRVAKGYGHFHIGPDTFKAHRIAYERANGAIPDDLCVLHRCDNPACCNPAHLWLGTRADNNADMVAKGRQRNRYGLEPGMVR